MYRGMGQTDYGLLANPTGTGDGSEPSTSTTTTVDTSSQNALQDFINALTPSQWAAYQGSNTPGSTPPANTGGFQWSALTLGLVALGVVFVMAPRGRR